VGDDSISRDERNEYLFHHLVAMFQTLALQQLGKLVSPITGKMERDLQQARITIDMLQMIKDRTKGNLEQGERMVLDRALLELQMNFVDEMKRGEEMPSETGGETDLEEPGGGEAGTERQVEEEGSEEAAPAEDDDADEPAPKKGESRTKTPKKKHKKR